MASRLRIGAALVGAIATLSFSALPASAEVVIVPDRGDQPQGEHVALKKKGNLPGHGERYLDTSLIKLRVIDQDEVKVLTYCVELPTDLKDGDHLKEAPWGTHPNKNSKFPENAGKVLWILTNSFPNVPVNDLKTKFELPDLDQKEAIAATQAAIWHFSDEAELDDGDERNKKDVVKLYDKLVSQAQDLKEQPKPTLEIEPSEKAGKSGEKIGPFVVSTSASEVKLTAKLPQGVTITNAAGEPMAVQKQGEELAVKGTGEKTSEFFVNVPAGTPAGDASFKVSAEAQLNLGRLFVARDKASTGDDQVAQSLVVATPKKVKVEKDAKAKWTVEVKPTEPSTTTPTTSETTPTTPTTSTTTPNAPAPGGSGDDLASTGASILWPLVGGLALVGAGVGAFFVARRKKAGA